MPKTGARYRKERRGRVKKDKEEKRRLGRERAAESYARKRTFAAFYKMRPLQKQRWRDGGHVEGHFVIATNVSAVHCVLQRQPAFPCLLRSLYYPSMPWSFRDRIIFFAVNGNY